MQQYHHSAHNDNEFNNLKSLYFLFLLFFLYSFMGTSYAAESDPPVLNAISVDKTVVDVSNGSQTVTFSIDVFDDSEIDWALSYIMIRSTTGVLKWINGSQSNIISVPFDTSDPSGIYEILQLRIFDIHGNQATYSSSDLLNFGLPSLISVSSEIESDPPVLNAISVDKTVVDVSNGSQTVTFSIDVFDDSEIDWALSYIMIRSTTGVLKWINGSQSNIISVPFDTSDPSGIYEILQLRIFDIHGNQATYSSSDLLNFGLPSLISVSSEIESDFDFDNNGTLDALTDGLLLLRYAFGLRGDNLTNAAIGLGSSLTPEEVATNVEQAASLADIDNSGTLDALTDGLIFLRYAFGLRGDNLLSGAISSDATRTLATDIEAYIESHMP